MSEDKVQPRITSIRIKGNAAPVLNALNKAQDKEVARLKARIAKLEKGLREIKGHGATGVWSAAICTRMATQALEQEDEV